MKKRFSYLMTLLCLLLCGASNSWSQTAVTATWAFESGADGQTCTLSDDGAFSVTSVSVAKLKYIGAITFVEKNGTRLQPTEQASDDGSQYVKFIVTPKKGITFVPTSISFEAIRVGTDGNNKLHYYAECGATKKELGNVNPNRNNSSAWSSYSHDITDISSTSENPFSIACYIYGLATTKDLAFRNIVIKGTYTGVAEEETLYSITTSVTPDGAGSIVQTPSGASLPEGSSVTFSATPNSGYSFLNKWTVNGEEVEGATYSVASLSEDKNVVAQFKKLPVITYAKPDGVECAYRMFPENVNNIEEGGTFTLPVNYMYWKEGYTMTGWSDGANTYKPGATFTVTGDATLTPIFTKNTTSVATRCSKVSVKFDFNQSTNGGRVVNIEQNSDKLITTATIDGNTIDVAIDVNCIKGAVVDGKNGKLNNTSGTTAQCNLYTMFTIPVVKGSVISILDSKSNLSATSFTFNGEEAGVQDGSNTKKVNYTASEDGNVVVITKQSNLYLSYINVVYPIPTQPATISAGGYTTFCPLYSNVTIPDGVTAYTAAVNAAKDAVVLTEVASGKLPKGCGVVLGGTANETYKFEATTEAAALAAGNQMVGATADKTDLTDVYVLGVKDGSCLFGTWSGTTFPAGKAYLNYWSVAAAPSFRIVLNDEATGINALTNEQTKSGQGYNLAGQKVGKDFRGIVIVNGKKTIIK